MAQDITLMGAQYEGVPAVDLPKTGGGTARFIDALGVVTSLNGEKGDITLTASDLGALGGNAGGLFYGTCATAAKTVDKVVECTDFTADNLKAGTIILVSFSATNSGAVASLTLNVNDTGAKPIKYINNGTLGNLSSAGYLKANTEYPFYYDGANWVCWFNYNTTYSAMTEAEMETGTATSNRVITATRLKSAVQYHAPVKSVNGSTGDVVLTIPTKTSDLTNDSGFITSAPVTSVNGSTGAVTVVEGLEPLVGTTSTVTPQQVMTALGEGRDVYISKAASVVGVAAELKFTSFSRVTDTTYSGQAIDLVIAQAIASTPYGWELFELQGGVYNGSAMAWTLYNTFFVESSRKINGHDLSSDITLTASDILPSVTSSDAGKFLRVNSSGSWAVEAVQSAESEAY